MVNYDFRRRIGIVTGAGSGIGRATALRLVASGATVVAMGRRQDALAETANEAAKLDGRFVPKAIDVTSESQYRAAIADVKSTFGPISFLFSNAGIGGAHKALIDLSLDELDAIMNVSFRAVFIGMKYALPAIKRAGGGAILNCGSLLSLKGALCRGDYAAAKHAVIHRPRQPSANMRKIAFRSIASALAQSILRSSTRPRSWSIPAIQTTSGANSRQQFQWVATAPLRR